VADERTRAVAPEKAALYLQRADELMESVSSSDERGHRIAAGVEAVQAAIACADAVTVAWLGLRSVGPDHGAAVQLLRRSGAPGAGEYAGQLKRVLSVKNLMEYDDRPPTLGEARDVVERARRLHRWAAAAVGTAP
jgi:hypothetical protein